MVIGVQNLLDVLVQIIGTAYVIKNILAFTAVMVVDDTAVVDKVGKTWKIFISGFGTMSKPGIVENHVHVTERCHISDLAGKQEANIVIRTHVTTILL